MSAQHVGYIHFRLKYSYQVSALTVPTVKILSLWIICQVVPCPGCRRWIYQYIYRHVQPRSHWRSLRASTKNRCNSIFKAEKCKSHRKKAKLSGTVRYNFRHRSWLHLEFQIRRKSQYCYLESRTSSNRNPSTVILNQGLAQTYVTFLQYGDLL